MTTKDAVSGELVDQFTLSKQDRDEESEVPVEDDKDGDNATGSSNLGLAAIFAPVLAIFGFVGGLFVGGGSLAEFFANLGVKMPF